MGVVEADGAGNPMDRIQKKNKTTDRRSCRNMHMGSLECFPGS